ncbi:hypothetical protein ACGFT2_28405 [Streptomyces sp. NPDC048514]|uniref:COG1470 family protein n=1 Tax=Streptomyces sp. NPDC048514 TaxID=3365564 RepID=UPI003713B6B4
MPSATTRVPHRRRHLFPAAAGSAALCLLALPSAAPRAAAAGSWTVAPAGGGRPSLYAEGAPGAVLQDEVSITNPGRTPLVVRLSGTGLPIAFADQAPRVPARMRADVPFAVTVPAGAAPGDRSGAVVARAAGGRTATVALRLRVVAPALAALTVEHLAVHAGRITCELVNRGTTVLVPRFAVRADGVLGRVLDRPPRDLPVRLRPGTRLKLSEPWPDRPALDAVDVRVTVTAAGGAHDTATTTARFVPWAVPAGTAGMLAAGTAAVIALRRRGSRRTDGGGAVGEGRVVGGGAAGEGRVVGGGAVGRGAAGAPSAGAELAGGPVK